MKYGKFYILTVFIFVLSLCLGYISGLGAVFQLFFGLCFYTLVAYVFSSVWRFFRKKEKRSLQDFSLYFLPKILGGLALLILVLLSFSFYQNIVSPAKMPLYTLSNGEKTLKFQTMSHVASKNFYAGVQSEIRKSKQEDFVLFYEGVGAGSEESARIFNQALGINFEADLYTNFSKQYGIVAQNNDDFLGIMNNADYNVDLNLDQVVKIYTQKQEKASSEIQEKNNTSEEVLDINSEVIKILAELSLRELGVMRFLNQSIMNFMIKHEGLRNTIIHQLGNTDIFGVILDDRNEHLVSEILKSDEDKIHILYGLMHFSGVLKLLQEQDSKWKTIETQYSQVIDQPAP